MTTTDTTRAQDARLHQLIHGGNFRRGDDWITEVDIWVDGKLQRLEVPHYHTNDIAIRNAETALAPELHEDYVDELNTVQGRALVPNNYTAMFALITASAQQRATAMCNVLERARTKEGVE